MFDSHTNLHHSQTHNEPGYFGSCLTPILIYIILKHRQQSLLPLLGLTPILIYIILKRRCWISSRSTRLTPILIYIILKPKSYRPHQSRGLTPILIYIILKHGLFSVGLPVFDSHTNLHHSQTRRCSSIWSFRFDSHTNLHHSQTTWDCPNNINCLTPILIYIILKQPSYIVCMFASLTPILIYIILKHDVCTLTGY